MLLKIAFEIDELPVCVAVGQWLGGQPIHDLVLQRVGKEVIASRIVMADEIAFEVVGNTQIEGLIVLAVHEIHIEHCEVVLLQEVHNLLVVARLAFQERAGHTGGIQEEDAHLKVPHLV